MSQYIKSCTGWEELREVSPIGARMSRMHACMGRWVQAQLHGSMGRWVQAQVAWRRLIGRGDGVSGGLDAGQGMGKRLSMRVHAC